MKLRLIVLILALAGCSREPIVRFNSGGDGMQSQEARQLAEEYVRSLGLSNAVMTEEIGDFKSFRYHFSMNGFRIDRTIRVDRTTRYVMSVPLTR
jgi:hypothetical protein